MEIIVTFGFRVLSALGAVLLSFIIARSGGASALGQFTVFLVLLSTLSILARRGYDTLLIRAVAQRDRSEMASLLLLLSAGRKTAPGVLIIALLGAGLLGFGVFGTPYPGSAPAFLLSLPVLTALSLLSGYLKGSGRAWISVIFDLGGVSMVASMLAAVILLRSETSADISFVRIFVYALIGVLFFGVVLLWTDARKKVTSITTALEPLGTRSLEFTIIALSAYLVQAGAFLLASPFLPPDSLGLVRGAERLALVVSFPVLAIGPVIMPRIVRAALSGNTFELRKIVTVAIGAGAAMGILPLMVILTMPGLILGIFGPEFREVQNILRILATTHFIFLLLAPYIEMLNMGGGERAAMWINIGSLLTALLLFPLLSHFFGINGFVAAYVIIMLGRGGSIVMASIQLHGSIKIRSLRETD